MAKPNFKKCRFEQLDILLFYDIYFLRKNGNVVPFLNADIPEPDQPEYCSHLLYSQKGLRRIPVPNGEKGFTFAHIRASFSEMADLPSSRKNAGPCQTKKGQM